MKNYLIIYPRNALCTSDAFKELHDHALSLYDRLLQKDDANVDLISIPTNTSFFMLPSPICWPDVVYVVGHHFNGSFGSKRTNEGIDFTSEQLAAWLNACDFLQSGKCTLKLMACYTGSPLKKFQNESFAEKVKKQLDNPDIIVCGYDGPVGEYPERNDGRSRWHTYSKKEGVRVRASAVSIFYSTVSEKAGSSGCSSHCDVEMSQKKM